MPYCSGCEKPSRSTKMGKIDWFFDHEAVYFETRLQKLVLDIFRLATEQLELVYSKEIAEAERHEGLDPDECAALQDYLRGEQMSQQLALSTMPLTMLASLIEAFLNEARTRLDQSAFPPLENAPPEKDEGKSNLLKRRVREYKERFKVDLTSLPGFDAVREVVLARNSCVHNDGHPSSDYLKKTKKRFLSRSIQPFVGGIRISRMKIVSLAATRRL
jgi:hypothetical protein